MRSAMSRLRQRAQHPLVGLFALEPAQRREIAQVLLDGEIEVERRLLEHDAERSERLGAVFRSGAAGRSRCGRPARRTAA